MNTQWRNRIVGYGEEAPDQLLAHPLNWSIHTATQQDVVSGILSEVGYVDEVTVNRRTGFIVDGHLRVTLALRAGQESIPVKYVDLDEAEEALVLATLDTSTGLKGIDSHQLAEVLSAAATESVPVQQFLDDLAQEAIAIGTAALDSGEGSGGRLPGPTAASVKVVISIDQADVFEQALKATGAASRAEALVIISSQYLTTKNEVSVAEG